MVVLLSSTWKLTFCDRKDFHLHLKIGFILKTRFLGDWLALRALKLFLRGEPLQEDFQLFRLCFRFYNIRFFNWAKWVSFRLKVKIEPSRQNYKTDSFTNIT